MDSFLSKEELQKIGFSALGDNVFISRKASIYGPEKITIGSHVRIDDFCILSGNISVGNYVHIAAYSALYGGACGISVGDFVNISSRNAIYAVSDDYSGATLPGPMIDYDGKVREERHVTIGSHVIIGSGCVVLPGSKIGVGAAIGAMSLIKTEIAEFIIAAGIPARKISNRERTLLELEKKMITP